jgi:hypothetical protein
MPLGCTARWQSRKSGHSSIDLMRHRKLWITGGIAVAGGALFRVLRHRKQPDPADELRRKLDESRSVADERDEFEGAEVPVDQAEPGVDERRREAHERGRSVLEDMRGSAEQ